MKQIRKHVTQQPTRKHVGPSTRGRNGPIAIRKDYLPFGRPDYSSLEIDAVIRIMRSGWVGMGAETIAFEQELAAYIGAPHVVTVNSCTSAIFLSLLVAGVGPGDEVICPSLTWCSTANAALYLRATPVFCDIDPDTWCATPDTICEKVTSRTKAVIVVHFGGLTINVDALRRRLPIQIPIIEDAAHAFGSSFQDGRAVGSSGNMTCFSFYANKNLSTGEGGAIALFDDNLAARLRSLRQHGLPLDAWKRFSHPQMLLTNELTDLGYKMNYTDLQAVIGRVQLSRFPELARARAIVAQCYVERLHAMVPGIKLQKGCIDSGHARHLFVLQLPLAHLRTDRNDFLLALRARNVGAAIHYAPLHAMPLYCQDSSPPSLPHTEAVGKSTLTLPISSSMTIQDAQYAVDQFQSVLQAMIKS